MSLKEIVEILTKINENLERIVTAIGDRQLIEETLKKWLKGELADLGGEKDS